MVTVFSGVEPNPTRFYLGYIPKGWLACLVEGPKGVALLSLLYGCIGAQSGA